MTNAIPKPVSHGEMMWRLTELVILLRQIPGRPCLFSLSVEQLETVDRSVLFIERLLLEKERKRIMRRRRAAVTKMQRLLRSMKTGFRNLFTKSIAYGKHRGEGPLRKKLKTFPRYAEGGNLLTVKNQNNL